MDLGFRTLATKIFVGTILKPVEATIASHPDIIGPYHAMCKANGIHLPPKILMSDRWHSATALTKENSILVGSSYLDYIMPKESWPALLAHETAHILAGDVGISNKAMEHLADSRAVQLLRSKDSVLSMLEAMHAFPRLPHEEALEIQMYGTQEERLKNTQEASTEMSAELQALIDKYNARMAKQSRQR